MPTIIDIAIGIIALIAAITGLVKGFTKQFVKGFCSLVSFFGALALAILLTPLIQQTEFFKNFSMTATGWFTADYFSTPVHSIEELNAVLGQSFLKILESVSDRIYTNTMLPGEMTTLGQYFGHVCATLIVGFVIWLLLLLIIKLALFGVQKLLTKLSQLPVLRTLDKIFGLVWSLGVTYLFVVCIGITAVEIVIVKFLPNQIDTFLRPLIENTFVFKVLHETNLVGSYIADLLGIDLLSLAALA
ncbi:MAG: CvpA family protein [Firmicutes bacterium]|nr:CvpA family protein [Bacillota bacterium]